MNKYSNQDSRIKVYTQKNSGPSSARNYGLDMANGEYILFCDSDDYLEDNYIQNLVYTMEDINADIVVSGYKDISKYGTLNLNDFWDDKLIIDKEKFIDCIFKGVGGTLWGKIFKKEIILKNNLRLDPDIYVSEDMIFVLKYSILCNRFGVINENLYNYYRLNDSSISTTMNISYYKNLIKALEEIERILKSNNFSVDYTEKIISNRIKNMILSFLIIQHNKKNKYSKSEKITNIKYITSNKNVKKYLHKISITSFTDRIIIKLMINERYNELNLY